MLAASVALALAKASSSRGELTMSSSPCTTSTSEPPRSTVSILRGRSNVCVEERINVGAKPRLAGAEEPPTVFSFRRSRPDI